MRLNWLGYAYRTYDGYGRYGTHLIRALERAGVDIWVHFSECAQAPSWLQERWGADWSNLTISCLPPKYLHKVPGRHWLLTMTEGSKAPQEWVERIHECAIERVIVPCVHNAEAFRESGVTVPIIVIPGGTDPDEFPYSPPDLTEVTADMRPYTFLALADRGERKGWGEVYDAFFQAFGTVEDTGPDKVRLIVKARPGGNDLVDLIVDKCANIDPRITFLVDDVADMRAVYRMADCFAIPSRCEGWGMPQREAAMMGIPVITQAHGGTDDAREWALVVEKGVMRPIPKQFNDHLLGEWRVADKDELAGLMRWCVQEPSLVQRRYGNRGAWWLREHQTWQHSAAHLLQLLQQEGAFAREVVYA